MATNFSNVLRVNRIEEQTSFRRAVATVLVEIQRAHGLTLEEIAEAIDVSLGTVSNAANCKVDLSSTYLQRLGKVFGPEVLNPVAALSGGQIVPIEAREADPLPSLAASVHRIAVARSPDSEAGTALSHRELLAMVPELREAVSALNALLQRAERIAA
jgi:transcriptional regulator with XRE-family HTH domain